MKKFFFFASFLVVSSVAFSQYMAGYTIVNPEGYYYRSAYRPAPIIFMYRQMDGAMGMSHCYPRVLGYDSVKNVLTYGCDFYTTYYDYIPYAQFRDLK